MKEYDISIGIEGAKIFSGLKETMGGLEQVADKASQTGEALDEAFKKGQKASEKLDNNLKTTSDNVEALSAIAKTAGKDLVENLSGKNLDASDFTKKIELFKKGLTEITTKKTIDVKVEEKAVKELQGVTDYLRKNFEAIQSELNSGISKFEENIQQNRSNIQQLDADIKNLESTIDTLAPSADKLNMENELKSAIQALEEERAILRENEQGLKSLTSANKDLAKSIQQADNVIKETNGSTKTLNSTFEEVYGDLQPLTTRLGEMEDRLYELYLAGQKNTQEFKDLQKEAIRLRQTMLEVDAQIDTFADKGARVEAFVQAVSGIAGGFAIAQGAMGLFGQESEEIEKALLKVNSAMAILQGLQEVSEILNKQSAFSVLLLRNARVQDTVSTVAQTTAMTALASAQAVETVATEALTVADYNLLQATTAVTVATEAHAVANTEETASALANATATEAQALAKRELAVAELASAKNAVLQAEAQVAQTTAMNGASVASRVLKFALAGIGIGLLIIAVALLVEYWDDITASVKKFLPAGESVGKTFDKIKSYALGVGNAVLQFVIAPLKALYELISSGDIDKALDTYMDSLDVVSNYNEGFRKQEARNAQKYRNEQEQANIDFAKRELERRKNRGEDVYQLEQRLLARQMALNKRTNKDNAELRKEYEDAEDKRFAENAKKAEEIRKKAEADAKRKADEAKKKAEEEAKKNRDLTLKYADEISKLELEKMDEGLEKKLRIIENERRLREEAILREGASSKSAIAKQQRLIQELNEQAERKKMDTIEQSMIERLKFEMEANKELASLQKDGIDKELDLLAIEAQSSLDAINEKYKDDEALRLQLIEATEKNIAEKTREIKAKYASESLDLEEQQALLSIELMEKYAQRSEQTEAQKQIAMLRVQLEFAKKRLDMIVDDGTEESKRLKVDAQRKVVQAQDAVNDAVKKNNNRDFDFMDFLGIGEGKSDEDRAKLKKAIGQSMQVLSDFTAFMIDNYQQQQDAKAEQVEQTQNEIDDLKDRLDEEKSLRDAGLANNVEVIEKEIAEKEKQKEEQLRQEQELLEKKKAMQKVQLALDTVSQLSGLITASVDIYKGFATIPIVGIPLAIAMIGTMFGSFIATKAKAAQAINQQTVQHKHGGEITGKSHDSGGEKYYSKDGKNVKELEAGEFVVRKQQYEKFGKLVRAINDDDLSRLSIEDYAVAEIFRSLGFDFDTGLGEVKNLQLSLMSLGYSEKESRHLSEISKGIAQLVESDKNTPKSYELNGFMCTKVGNTIFKRPLNLTPKKDNDTEE